MTAGAAALCWLLWLAGSGLAGEAPADGGGCGALLKGADVSLLQEIENRGGAFRDAGGRRDLLEILGDRGFNCVRLRLWHDPLGGYCGLDSTLAVAVRARSMGLGLLLDIHYSDTWADPGRQSKPRAWEGIAFEALEDSVCQYTGRVVGRFKSRGALPEMIQLGNEITCGLLWDDGRICGVDTAGQWRKLGRILKAGVRGVEAALDEGDSVRIMIHTDRGGDAQGSVAFYDRLLAEGVRLDVIGLSYYPWWHGSLDQLRHTLDTLAGRYRRDIVVVETAYPWTLGWGDGTHNVVGLAGQLHPGYPATVAGQRAFLADLLDEVGSVRDGRGKGVFYWAPEYISVPGLGSVWENLTLFDFDGDLLPSASAFAPADR
jgi:arabinogalactan endo-1,4-beta-galactosidase